MSNNKPIYTEINLVKPERVLKKEVINIRAENAYKNAQLENDRIENKLNQDKQRLDQFRSLVNERIRSYRIAQQIQNEYEKMKKLEKFNRIEKLKKTIDTQRVKSYIKQKKTSQQQIAKIPLILRSTNYNEKKLMRKSISALMISDQKNMEKNDNDLLRKQRVSYIRSAYGQHERNKSKIFVHKNRISESVYDQNKSKSLNNTKNSDKSFNTNILEQISNDLFDMNLSNNPLNSTIQSKKEQFNKDNENQEETLIDKKNNNNHVEPSTEASSFSSSCGSNKSMKKYLKYLKQLLKEKGNTIILPPVCQCNLGPSSKKKLSFDDFNHARVDLNDKHGWQNCANNCIFYKNPLEYARVLLDLVDGDREKLDYHQLN